MSVWTLLLGPWIVLGTGFVLYRLVFALLFHLVRAPAAIVSSRRQRFLILVPAWNEELRLGLLLDDIERLDYPQDLYEVAVLADRCTDSTAEVAKARKVRCVENSDDGPRTKAAPIDRFLEHHGVAGFDAVCILDADCRVVPGFLAEMNAALESGADVVQSDYGIANAGSSWLTRLTELSILMQTRLLLEGRSRLGLPAVVLGTGACFRAPLLARLGWRSESDRELTMRLTLAGTSVQYAPRTRVEQDFPASLRRARVQRQRWSRARLHGLRSHGMALLRRIAERPGLRILDQVTLLVVPPNSLLFNWNLFVFALAWLLPVAGPLRATATAAMVMEVSLVLLGVAAAPQRWAVALACVRLPIYLAWKAAIDLRTMLDRQLPRWSRSHRPDADAPRQ